MKSMKELASGINEVLKWGVNVDKQKFQERLSKWNQKPSNEKADDCATVSMIALGVGAGLMALSLIFSKRGEKDAKKKKLR